MDEALPPLLLLATTTERLEMSSRTLTADSPLALPLAPTDVSFASSPPLTFVVVRVSAAHAHS